ncbi:hypothetical protein EVC62_14910 [Salinicola endophyticus]|uniref:Uncharacterized protein n=1 Tax=Salinicola endophyticus TaxID=1949083 RepID=A0ABY8FIN4_9GAMM|nr:hypothetical protein [Salinicola endophyticus]WFF42679.1 hypothetical protein EVC62_14910 [Salinicola endophyticus]
MHELSPWRRPNGASSFDPCRITGHSVTAMSFIKLLLLALLILSSVKTGSLSALIKTAFLQCKRQPAATQKAKLSAPRQTPSLRSINLFNLSTQALDNDVTDIDTRMIEAHRPPEKHCLRDGK